MYQLQKILIVQTAFIGDVILATSLIEKLHAYFPDAAIDFLLRKGNEGLLADHPYVNQVLVWNKRENKLGNLLKLSKEVRKRKYDLVVNLQRFLSSGIITAYSGATYRIGFSKNPMSMFYTEKYEHQIGDGTHEVVRNLSLISKYTDNEFQQPKIHLTKAVVNSIRNYQDEPYLTIAPTSVWFTKQFPSEKWIGFIKKTRFKGGIYLLGGPADHEACEHIKNHSGRPQVNNLSGELTLVESAALMKGAVMNYVNDSAPQHLASAVNAPVCSVFCSTIPDFGFGPLSTHQHVIQVKEPLSCRPCGLHGFKSCPKGHFHCALKIETSALESVLY